MPDPIGLDAIRGNNRKQLQLLAKLIHCLCDGQPDTRFFLGSVSAGMLLGKPHQTIQNWMRQLTERGVVRRVWIGRPCKKDERGKPLPGGRMTDRASEYVYLGLPNGN
ncbi:hypothetical protein J8F10_06320 [Gemmata sp. G18]|uniref:Helix-turn-helix domain-containing protein n=1 Tax=Gemmata palustris TaxID=2822762 RepID=A0ABS5BN57_9BACT|nr:hypothetical protein [Gemmata palustris]MBP3954897.1 hypothetical protein [Gemmata palustris]